MLAEGSITRHTRGVADLATLHRFLLLWFGHEPTDDSDEPSGVVAPVMRFNRPVADTYEGKVQVLVVEQQGVWMWGRTEDGRFVEKENESEARWRDIDEDPMQFWLHHAAVEAVMELPASRSAQLLDAATVSRIRNAADPLPSGTWTWPGSVQAVHHHDASVLMICEDGPDFWVVASAPTEQALTWLDDMGLTWDERDTRTGP